MVQTIDTEKIARKARALSAKANMQKRDYKIQDTFYDPMNQTQEVFKRIVITPRKQEKVEIKLVQKTSHERYRDVVYDNFNKSARSISVASAKVDKEVLNIDSEIKRINKGIDEYRTAQKNLDTAIEKALNEVNTRPSHIQYLKDRKRMMGGRPATRNGVKVNKL